MAGENKALRTYAAFTAAMVVVLLLAGGLVTTTRTGDTIPTWPHWRGKIEGGTWVEWSHRALAGLVGILVLGLAVWLKRTLGWIALAGVVVQALIGGLRIYVPKALVSIVHATFAQVVFCAVVAVALMQSKAWSLRGTGEARGVGIAATASCLLQLIAGAVARHTGMGFEVHVLGAVVVLFFASILASRLLMTPLRRGAWVLTGLLAFQILLGVFTWMFTRTEGFVRSTEVPLFTLSIVSLHVATGAGLLAACLSLAILSGPAKAPGLRAVAA